MSRRWSYHEDLIVYYYCYEHECTYTSDADLEEVYNLLAEAGFTSRSKGAIKKRARDCEIVIQQRGISGLPKQLESIHQIASNKKNKKFFKWIQNYVDENYCPNDPIVEISDCYNVSPKNYTRYIEIEIPKLETEFKEVFDELLEKYYQKKVLEGGELARVKKDLKAFLSGPCCITYNTFYAIKREKYENVSKNNVLKLCFALELDYMDAERLMTSAGYIFRRNLKFDMVLAAILKSDNADKHKFGQVNDTLMKLKQAVLF